MHALAGIHPVRRKGLVERIGEPVPGEPDIHVDGFRAFEQAVQVPIEKGDAPVMDAQAFPDAVAEDEAGIEDRDCGFIPREQRAVDPDADLRVARIIQIGVRALAHQPNLEKSGARRSMKAVAASLNSSVRSWSANSPPSRSMRVCRSSGG